MAHRDLRNLFHLQLQTRNRVSSGLPFHSLPLDLLSVIAGPVKALPES